LDDSGKSIVRVFLTEDHAIVRIGLRAYFERIPNIEVVGEADSGRATLETLEDLAHRQALPDVLLLDLVLPGLDGVAVIAMVRRQYPSVEVVALTNYSEAERVHAALHAGASGYVLKGADVDEIAAAVLAAHRGQIHLDAGVARKLMQVLPTSRLGHASLTAREREVLLLVAEGMSNRDIAKALMISERTAQTHISKVLAKLNLTSRTQAALWAVREGLVDPR